jgi:catechol 2,3-dioxygenase-like lactoylglutathione lyase family enzyme
MYLGAFPILPARDLAATRVFYEHLGFTALGWWPDEFGGYAILARHEIEMHFFRVPELDPLRSYAQCYWRVADVDALYGEVVRAGVPTGTPPEDKPWGMREFALSDPNGTLLRLGQSLSPSEAAATKHWRRVRPNER